jgi:hypothetical protein
MFSGSNVREFTAIQMHVEGFLTACSIHCSSVERRYLAIIAAPAFLHFLRRDVFNPLIYFVSLSQVYRVDLANCS